MAMNYKTVSDTLLRVARQYDEDMNIARAVVRELKSEERLKNKNSDYRDFLPLITLMGIKGTTEAERTNDIREKLEELTVAFEDPDKSKREPYLNMLYDAVEEFGGKFDPDTADMDKEADVEKLLQGMLIDQTLGTKRAENPEYFSERYGNPATRSIMEARDGYRMAVSATIATNLFFNGIALDPILSLPKPYPPELSETQALREQYERTKMEKTVEAKGNLPEEKTIDFPILDSMIPSCGKNVADIPKFSKDAYDQVKYYYNYVIANTLLQEGTKNTQGLKEAVMKTREAIYIDGRPFEDFLAERYPNGLSNGIIEVTAATAILGGKHKVDIVNAYRNEAGEMQYEARTIRATITPEQEKLYLQQHSWLRRLFNWWPFKIETLQEKMDKIANDPKTDERLAGIIEDHKGKIEAGIERREESERQKILEKQQREQHRIAYKEAKTSLEESAIKWEKDSVIGILGQEIAAEYVFGNDKVQGICDALRKIMVGSVGSVRYEKSAPTLAKVVLYSQLLGEREANGGEPGKLEQALSTGNNIRENIENAAKNLAKDQVFKDLILKRMGIEENGIRVPDRDKFERLIISGAFKNGFWTEYMQNLKGMANQPVELQQSLPQLQQSGPDMQQIQQPEPPKSGPPSI